jgi:putative heme-binding domain-containing protein
MYPLTVSGAGFTGGLQEVVNGGDDTWSRPTDVAVAPDGAVFLSDWYDPGVGGHQMGDADGRGRIYRLAPVGNKPSVPKLDLTSPGGLTAALASPNQSTQFVARTALIAQGASAAAALLRMWHQNDPYLRARSLWILGTLGTAGTAAIQEALHDRDPRFRVLGLRVARQNGANMLELTKPVLHDESPQVRREIALVLRDANPALMLPPYLYKDQSQPSAEWLDAMTQLASQFDGKDRWYLEAMGIAARGREDALYAKLKSERTLSSVAFSQIVWELRPKSALPDLVATLNNASASLPERTTALESLGAMQWPEAARALESFIVSAGAPPQLTDRAFGLYSHQLFSMWTDARTSQGLPAVMRKAFATPSTQSEAAAVAEALEDPAYIPDLLTLAKSESATPESRAAAVDAVGTKRDAKYVADFQAIAQQGPARVRVSAIRALTTAGQSGLESWAQGILMSSAPNEVRAEALRLLGSTLPGLTAILDLADQGKIPMEFQTLARNLTNYATPPGAPRPRTAGQSPVAMRVSRTAPPADPAYVAIRARAAKALPIPAARKLPTAFELEQNYAGHAGDGRKIFDADGGCAACHSLGGKKKLGPDLSAIGAKYGRQAMLDNITNPSDAIGPEYVPTTFTMKSGEKLSGLISEETPDHIVIQTGPDAAQRVKASDVASRDEVRVSLMPEGLLGNLSQQQLADLLEFLATLK